MAKLFYKTISNNQSEGPNESRRNVGKFIGVSLALVIALVILIYGGLQFKGFYDKVSSNWAEIKFAYEKPALVKTVRQDYESKTKQLDQSYIQKEKPLTQDEIIDAVVQRIEEEQSKSSDLSTRR